MLAIQCCTLFQLLSHLDCTIPLVIMLAGFKALLLPPAAPLLLLVLLLPL
jgi:hypothetical protein